jgi:hypothetical protein
MNQLANVTSALVILMAAACGNNSGSSSLETSSKMLAVPATQQPAFEPLERKLIKEGRVEFETESLEETRKIIITSVEKYQGYVSSDQEYNSPERISNTLMIRVPSDHFDQLLADATRGVSRFDSKEITVHDVTEEFVDIEARLKTKKELESRYLDLLRQAKSVTDILAIEKQTNDLRAEIESIEGRLKYLQSQVSYSTLTITIYEEIPKQHAFGKKFKEGFRNGWTNLIWFFVLLTNIWPFVLFIIALVTGILFFRKKPGR